MHITTRTGIAFALIMLAGGIRADAQDCRFFRIVSTQATEIVSLDSTGLLVWSNAVPGAPCQVETRHTRGAAWTNDCPTSPLHSNGALAQVRVPLGSVLQCWIVAFQPGVTLEQAEALFDINHLVWQPLAFDSLGMAVAYSLPGDYLPAVRQSPDVRYVEPDYVLTMY